jgi:hypothetical protein
MYAQTHASIHRWVRTAARSLNYDIVWRTFYNGIPHLEEIPDDVWTRRSAMAGVALDLKRCRRTVAELVELALTAGFSPPLEPPQERRYFTENGSFGLRDGAVLWGLLRRLRPTRVIELGSGYSTMLIAEALGANDASGIEARHVVIDPYPGEALDVISRQYELIRRSVTDVENDRFAELREDDVLFVDTTHTVKVGGDVAQVVLELLPLLDAGVFVHFHDVFLPYEYPRRFFELGYNWTEQYLLQAFLQFNETFEVVAPLHQLAVEDESVFAALDGLSPTASRECASFWIRKTA